MFTNDLSIRKQGAVSGNHRIRRLILMLGLTGLLSPPYVRMLRAQSVTAILVGTVSDQTGAVVPGAAVSVTMVGTNAKRTVLTTENGDFTVAGLAPGAYRLVAE